MGIDGRGPCGDNPRRGLSPRHEPLLLTPNFDIKSVPTGDAIVVEVSGEVDLLTAPVLAEELRRAQRTRSEVIVDLEKVEFMGCVALQVLVRAAIAPGPGQPRIWVTPGPPQVQKLFRLTRMDEQLRIVERSRVGPSSGRRRSHWRWAGTVPAVTAADAA